MKLKKPEKIADDMTWSEEVKQDTSVLMRKGGRYVLGTLAVFGLWAILAPLSSSVVANGRVMAASQNKLLQHPTGGVVRSIVAQDGARLKAGDIVVEIDPEANQADLARLKGRYELLTAQKARFEAEKYWPIVGNIFSFNGNRAPSGPRC